MCTRATARRSIFRGDASVFTLSIHGQRNFPFRKEASDLDVDLPDGCRDDDYLQALEQALDELAQPVRSRAGDLSGRCRPARRRPPGPPQTDLGRAGGAGPPGVRLGLAAPRAAGLCHGRRLRPPNIEDTVQRAGQHLPVAMDYWRRWQNRRHEPAKPAKPQVRAAQRSYKVFRPISTRWMDNDAYGHVNNVVYYSWFDTVVNAHLIEQGVLDIHQGETIGLVIETQCNYFASLAFPADGGSGLACGAHGQSSVRYEVGLFARAKLTAAKGHFIHVYVDKQTRRPVPLPPPLKSVLEKLNDRMPKSAPWSQTRPAWMPPSKAAFRRAPSCPARAARLIPSILQVASRAPSGTNTQPWKVYVLQGASRDSLVRQGLRRA
jgi:acyl-CoA thioester hydrolase